MEYRVLRPMEDIVVIRLIHNIDLRMLTELYDELKVEVFHGAPNPIFMIYDVERVERFAVNVSEIQYASTDILDHENLGAIIVMGITHPLMIFVAKIVLYLARIRSYFVSDIVEAMETAEILRNHPAPSRWEPPEDD